MSTGGVPVVTVGDSVVGVPVKRVICALHFDFRKCFLQVTDEYMYWLA